MILADSNLFMMFTTTIAVLAVLTLNSLRRFMIFKSMDNRQVTEPVIQGAYAKLAVEFPAVREIKKAMVYGAVTAVVAGVMFTF